MAMSGGGGGGGLIGNQRNADGRHHARVADHLHGGHAVPAARHHGCAAEEHEQPGCRSEHYQGVVDRDFSPERR